MHKNILKKSERGFTLIETIIAILILSLSIGALLTLAAGGFFSVRYARNQIVADNLMQETLEHLRNSRDSAALQGVSWATWIGTLEVDANGQPAGAGAGCFKTDGCIVDPYTSVAPIKACSGVCPTILLYPDEGFYGYSGASYPFSGGASPVATTYVRTVTATLPQAGQLVVTVRVRWRNGSATKTVSQSMLLTNWNQ